MAGCTADSQPEPTTPINSQLATPPTPAIPTATAFPTVVPATPAATPSLPLRTPVPTPTRFTAAPLPEGNLLLYGVPEPAGGDVYWALKALPPLPLFDEPLFAAFYGRHAQLDSLELYLHNFAPQVSPDGRYLALPGIGGYDNPSGDLGTGFWLVDLRDLRTGSLCQLLPQAQVFTWSPDSQHIAYVDDGTLYTLAVTDETAEPIPLFSSNNLWDLYARWSPDGRTIVAVSIEPAATNTPDHTQGSEIIWLVPSSGDPPRELVRRPHFAIEHVANEINWSPDGQYLLVRQEVLNLAGETVTELPGWAHWLPQQNRLLVSSHEETWMMTANGQEVIRIHSAFMHNWAVSHDGRQLAYVQPSDAQSVVIFDLETYEKQLINSIPAGKAGTLAWSADNSALFVDVQGSHEPIWLLEAQPGGMARPVVRRGTLVDVFALPMP